VATAARETNLGAELQCLPGPGWLAPPRGERLDGIVSGVNAVFAGLG
jgi:hypothetical protein